MNVKKVLESLDILPSEEEKKLLKYETDTFVKELRTAVRKEKSSADIFVGGSFAKNTLVKKDAYDIDIFVRFDWRHEELTALLARIVQRACAGRGFDIKRLHGSRDYFHVRKKKRMIFEIVPVVLIKKPREARNVTDLSYFHVSYVKKALRRNKKLAREIALAKTFCRAQGCYGAESYIQGFSGYGLECLLIHYMSFKKMAMVLAKNSERAVIDPAKHFKNKNDVFFSMNESKMHSPIILVDPTWKERNVLAALSHETFHKFQEAVRVFLKHPSKDFFKVKDLDVEQLKKEALQDKAEFLHLRLSTDRQAGDIAGTKLKKFAQFFGRELSPLFSIIKKAFVYDEEQSADVYYLLKSKKEFVKRGPPAAMKKDALAFKKVNRVVFAKDGRLYARMALPASGKAFSRTWMRKNKKKSEGMGISKTKLL